MKTVVGNSLNRKAMLVTLSISYWSSRKYDRKVSQEVADTHKTDQRAGRYRKNLLPVDAPSYQGVRNTISAARDEHYKHSLPWSSDGARILPAANFERYAEAMRSKRAAFDKAVQVFIAEYPALREQAKEALNTMYQAEDYPMPSEIPQRFGFATKVFPLPAGEDFRVELTDVDTTEIRAQIERETKAAVAEGMKDAYGRLHEVVARMAARLGDPDGKFKNSLVENIRELCDLLPSLNLTGDTQLTRLVNDAKKMLTTNEADDLRNDAALRNKVAYDARRIEHDLAAFMGR